MAQPASVRLTVNGKVHLLDVPLDASLLHVLRNDLRLNGPKYGCGLGQCGSCTVIIDGKAARACVLVASVLEGFSITTLEGLGDRNFPHPMQRSVIEGSSSQCGYCLNGMIMTIAAVLGRNPLASDAEIREALCYNLCRCGSHVDIMQAARAAAAEICHLPVR